MKRADHEYNLCAFASTSTPSYACVSLNPVSTESIKHSPMPLGKRKRDGDAGVLPKKKARKAPKPAVRARHQFYTWPRCGMEPTDCLKHIVDTFGDVDKYIVARERHDETEEERDPMDVDAPEWSPFHLHAYVKYSKQKRCYFEKLHLTDADGVVFQGERVHSLPLSPKRVVC